MILLGKYAILSLGWLFIVSIRVLQSQEFHRTQYFCTFNLGSGSIYIFDNIKTNDTI